MCRKLVLVFLLAIGLVACDGSPAPSPGESPAPGGAPVQISPARCPNQQASFEPPSKGIRQADVTGDGSTDRVWVVPAADPSPGCSAFLVLDAERDAVLPLHLEDQLAPPSIETTIEADGRPGDEVVVLEAAGASTVFFGLYTFDDGKLVRMNFQGSEATPGSLLPSGGSVGHLDATDCAGEGTIVVSSAESSGPRYKVIRRFFVASGTDFVLDGAATKIRRASARRVSKLAEYRATPFGSC